MGFEGGEEIGGDETLGPEVRLDCPQLDKIRIVSMAGRIFLVIRLLLDVGL